MSDQVSIDESKILESFRVCRAEVHHEYDVLSSRLNSYMTSQAFLVSGYAISMGNVVQNTGREFRFIFPLILSAVALLLSFRAQPGITGACKVIAEWHLKQEKLFLSGTVLDDYSVLRRVDITESHEKNLWFAQTAPWIFGSAWILMAILAVYLHGQP